MSIQFALKSVINLGRMALLSLALVLAGCTIQSPRTPVVDADATPTIQPEEADDTGDADSAASEGGAINEVGAYRPIDSEICAALQEEMTQALNVEVTRNNAVPFQSTIGGFMAASCQLIAEGTGEDFTNYIDVANELIALLEGQGWHQDPEYVADSPTGTVIGLRRENALAVVQSHWEPAPDAECPEDQIISECGEQLEPNQMLYLVTIDLVEAE